MFDIDSIKEKKKVLVEVGDLLKKDFVGLDDIIDKIIGSIEVWYVLPKLLTRPLILNLWGMTGVGKTDLVRKLVAYLNFKDRYLEIQLNPDRYAKVQDKLLNLSITANTQAVLLLDEVQRFSTVNQKGEPVKDNGYEDIWELLSDGSFSNAFEEQLRLHMLLYDLMWDQDSQDCSSGEKAEKGQDDEVVESKEKKKERKFKTYLWSARRFKRETECDLTIEEVMKLSVEDKLKIVEDKLANLKDSKDHKKYNNLLVIICGNLDEAYTMSGKVGDVDTDADVLYARSKKISVIDVKNALKDKFKPEQIARLGNNHIIYPSLSKSGFQQLIVRNLEKIRSEFSRLSNVDVTYSDELNEVIYRNGVFPTQGVRPLFSTINSLVENVLPEFLLKALEGSSSSLMLSPDVGNSEMVAECLVGGKTVRHTKKVQFVINSLKGSINHNKLSLVAAHEVGHALAYMLNFKATPVQVCSNSVNYAEGFVIPHEITFSKDYLYKYVQIALAGKAAEEIIFGEMNVCNGSQSDISLATRTICAIVRSYSMGDIVGRVTPVGSTDMATDPMLTNDSETNSVVEDILKEQKALTARLLNENLPLMRKLIAELSVKKELLADDLYELSKDSIKGLRKLKLEDTIEHSFTESLQNFLGE